MRNFSHIWGPQHKLSGPDSFEITVLLYLLDEMWTFSIIWGPQREFTGPISLEITVLTDLFVKIRIFSLLWGPQREFSGATFFCNYNFAGHFK